MHRSNIGAFICDPERPRPPQNDLIWVLQLEAKASKLCSI